MNTSAIPLIAQNKLGRVLLKWPTDVISWLGKVLDKVFHQLEHFAQIDLYPFFIAFAVLFQSFNSSEMDDKRTLYSILYFKYFNALQESIEHRGALANDAR